MNITPGLVPDLGNEEYHRLTDWWSSTQLKRWLPENYKAPATTGALVFGNLLHAAVLEPDELGRYAVLDPHKIGVTAKGDKAASPKSTKAWKEAVAEAESAGLIVVDPDTWRQAVQMSEAVHDHDEARSLFTCDGVNEESAFWIDREGIQHKARFDRRISGALIDIKTTVAKPGEYSLTKVVLDTGYDLSAAHYTEVANGLGLDADAFVNVWIEKTYPYRVTVTELDHFFLERGRHLRRLALDRALSRVEPYEGATGRLILTPPAWAMTDDLELAL